MSNELDARRWESTVDRLLDGRLKIRKLTPRECARLQGIEDEVFEKAQFVNSDSQLYKQIGNAVTVPVMYEIAKRLNEREDTNEIERSK